MVDTTNGVLSGVESHLNSPCRVLNLLELLHKCYVCAGNYEEQFLELSQSRNGSMMSASKQL